MTKRRYVVIITFILCLLLFTACNPQYGEENAEYAKDNNSENIIESNAFKEVGNDAQNKETQDKSTDQGTDETTNELISYKVVSLSGVRGVEWISENTILSLNKNKEMPIIPMEGGDGYPTNVFKYDLSTKMETLLIDFPENIWDLSISPDRKSILCIGGGEGSPNDFIFNTENKEKIFLQEDQTISDKQWIDNSTLLYVIAGSWDGSTGISTINQIDIQGNKTQIEKISQIGFDSAAKLGDRLYYTLNDKSLYVRNVYKEDKVLLGEHMTRLYPFPDNSRLAAIGEGQGSKEELVLIDTEGKEIMKIEAGMDIEVVKWSPDGSKIAYSGSNDNKAGVFVAEAHTGRVAQLLEGVQYVTDVVSWSPSGEKILASDFNDNVYSTNIIYLK